MLWLWFNGSLHFEHHQDGSLFDWDPKATYMLQERVSQMLAASSLKPCFLSKIVSPNISYISSRRHAMWRLILTLNHWKVARACQCKILRDYISQHHGTLQMCQIHPIRFQSSWTPKVRVMAINIYPSERIWGPDFKALWHYLGGSRPSLCVSPHISCMLLCLL